jgi:hypothetical protein
MPNVVLLFLSIATPSSAQTNPLDPAPPTTQSTQRGFFKTTFYESSPLASKAESNRRFHWNDPIGEIQLGEESFEVYVPKDYRPEDPYGLLVWISSGGRGFIPVKKWVEVLDKHHLIWIGANKSGNERLVADRIRLAIEAACNMKRRFSIDEDRIYVSGVSGGGRTASMCATSFSDVFAGAVYIVGVNFYRDIPLPEKKNEFWPAQFYAPLPALLADQKRTHRYVLLTGDNDFNLSNTVAVYNSGYLKEGYQHVTLMQVPGMGHDVPDADWFEKAIAALDEPLPKIQAARAATRAAATQQAARRAPAKPTTTAATAPARAEAENPARDADRLLNLARSYIAAGSYAPARARLEKIISSYPNTTQAQDAKKLLREIESK